MKRFYNQAIKSLEVNLMTETLKDIESYVNLLEHEKSVLISELARSGGISSKQLLNRLGFKL